MKRATVRDVSRLSPERLLDAGPVRNEAVKPEQRGESLVLWVPLQKRWVVERTFDWWCWYRRLNVDYEYLPESSEAMIQIAMIRVMVRRLA